jgi:hypothetical protein
LRTSAATKRGGDDRRIVCFAEAELLVRCVCAVRRNEQLHHLKRQGLLENKRIKCAVDRLRGGGYGNSDR